MQQLDERRKTAGLEPLTDSLKAADNICKKLPQRVQN
jgi:hypothetical protein